LRLCTVGLILTLMSDGDKRKRAPVTETEKQSAWRKAYGLFYCSGCGCHYTAWCPKHGGPATAVETKRERVFDE
jgi:hypothetical protein